MATKRKHRVSKAKSASKSAKKKKSGAKLKLVVSRSTAKKKTQAKGKAKPIAKKKALKKPAKAVKKTTAPKQAPKKTKKKGISDKLLQVLEKRKKTVGTTPSVLFAKPAGRRGRRPKLNSDYNPDGAPEDPFNNENHLQYDTGIKLSNAVDSDGPSFERSDDFDEELNFDN